MADRKYVSRKPTWTNFACWSRELAIASDLQGQQRRVGSRCDRQRIAGPNYLLPLWPFPKIHDPSITRRRWSIPFIASSRSPATLKIYCLRFIRPTHHLIYCCGSGPWMGIPRWFADKFCRFDRDQGNSRDRACAVAVLQLLFGRSGNPASIAWTCDGKGRE